MIAKPSDRSFRPSRWTLAQRLSALFVGLLVLVVAVFGAVAYRGIHDAARMRATDRLTGIARELAGSAARGAVARTAVLREIADDPAIRRALIGGNVVPPRDAAMTRLERADAEEATRVDAQSHSLGSSPRTDRRLKSLLARKVRPGDSTLVGWYLLDTNRAIRYGGSVALVDAVPMDQAFRGALGASRVGRSVIFAAGERLHSWTAVAVEQDGQVIGVFAELRRLASAAPTEGLLARLSGQDATVYFTSRGSSEWASIRGRVVASPLGAMPAEAIADSGAVLVNDDVPEPTYAAVASVTGTPWQIVLTQREASILEKPRAFLVQLLITGALLILAGTVMAAWLSRLETRPLATLRRAAVAMAAGDYEQVVPAAGAEETAALADAFNLMATRISGAHATLAEQNAALQRANDAKARFLAVMSHEMRTPLNAIGGYANLIALGVHGPTTPDQREALERIDRSKEQLLRLVTDILHYARLEATPLPVTRECVSVREQFEALGSTFADQFARRGVALVIEPTDTSVYADGARVQQVLINLVSNALQFTDAGGVVTLTAVSDGVVTIICVTDTGCGIPPEQHASIFEPFVQTDSSLTRRAGGAGLGLAIVRQLVAAMHGSVQLESAVGKGSSFSVWLPSAESSHPEYAMTSAIAATSA